MSSQKILLFAFQNRNNTNYSGSILNQLHSVNIIKAYMRCESLQAFNESLQLLLHEVEENNIRQLIGMGEYSGRDNQKLRLETIVQNKFRNQAIGQETSFRLPRAYDVDKNLDQSFKIGTKMGNSWCNLICYRLMQLQTLEQIELDYLDFIHIPANISNAQAINAMNLLLKFEPK